MTSPDTRLPPGWVVVTIAQVDGTRLVPGLPTDCPHLAITPAVNGRGEVLGSWCLTHTPSGRCVPLTLDGGDKPPVLSRLAARVAHLDWSAASREDLPVGHVEAVWAAEARLAGELVRERDR